MLKYKKPQEYRLVCKTDVFIKLFYKNFLKYEVA